MTTPEQHANTVREALQHLRFSNGQPSLSKAWDANDARASLAALVALAERADTLERERDEAQQWWEDNFATPDDEPPDPDTAQMLDFVFRWGNSAWGAAGQESQRAEQARAEADRLRETLRQLGDRDNWSMTNEDAERYGFESGPWYFDGDGLGIEPWEVVRAALAGPQTKEQT